MFIEIKTHTLNIYFFILLSNQPYNKWYGLFIVAHSK